MSTVTQLTKTARAGCTYVVRPDGERTLLLDRVHASAPTSINTQLTRHAALTPSLSRMRRRPVIPMAAARAPVLLCRTRHAHASEHRVTSDAEVADTDEVARVQRQRRLELRPAAKLGRLCMRRRTGGRRHAAHRVVQAQASCAPSHTHPALTRPSSVSAKRSRHVHVFPAPCLAHLASSD